MTNKVGVEPDNNNIIVGVDLDNTIVNYDNSLHRIALEQGFIEKNMSKDKIVIRDYIRSKAKPKGEFNWQKLQALVYGLKMDNAELVDGVADFFLLCKKHNIPTYIISHKTEISNYKPKNNNEEKLTSINLRKAALKWLKKNGFFDKLGLAHEQVFFLSTREGKIDKIKELGCTHFIDDLEEVFTHPGFPKNVLKILYSKKLVSKPSLNDLFVCTEWSQINNYFFGEKELRELFSNLLGKKAGSLERIGGGRNSKVYKITAGSQTFLGKQYFKYRNDKRDRLKTEYSSLEFLRKNKVVCIPEPIAKDSDNNCAVYEFVKGKKVVSPKEDTVQIINFVAQLKKLALTKPRPIFPSASDACFSFQAIVDIIERRLKKLNITKSRNEKDQLFKGLHEFLKNDFNQTYIKIIKWAKEQANKSSIDFAKELEPEFQTLSPSDLGFHNSIKTTNGKLMFIDFEYFGYDSPMKLICDFIHHDNMKLNDEQKQKFVSGVLSIFKEDIHLQDRVRIAYPLIGLVWCLIFLNEYLHDDIKRRQFAKSNLKGNNAKIYNVQVIRNIRRKQIEKSKMLLNKIIKTYKDFPYNK
ncbi:MAG: hypothetical protein KKF46_00830 [Nanoarchaeota archaeon]|nr:hypothetical protein [Nanoarchaeota archaeon]MBU1320878.1 hypothetical protein [Nanoarchaeota archaeon]MBU1597784.1 hypothetical protein [Nanoarchaeota archaeon]MBU2441235.1 hypothetical protein [Nanoarchaeota archaeon]